ncbi:sugar (and other) transporter family protein [Bacillus cereus ATCC 4342]|uniref:MFS transporter n=1 Tax=Bacillus tropicus TaxID=2026188 RepID=UPI0001A0173B|nr:MFS transporter [Bacillus tropicus]AJH74016.1 sugar (and other) transporter family protein [Bacillus cereus ATCC 4342]EEK85609.1 Major facilitator superfamily MFS_1 [Bacillus cereus ATCC 4342]KFM88471.1 sugar (and other) transporter family protein [Bacillus cereus ATCC 4342]MDR4453921.1 MFS transporter [Bacillus tropicus]QKH54202.1 MFS transporter [Bacillus tropicus]
MSTLNSDVNPRLALISLMISTFAIGTTEFIIMGILPDVAKDLNVSISSTGLLVTGYAIGVAIGAPLLTALTGKMQRKKLLLMLMLLFVIGNTLCAVAPTYEFLLVSRVLAAFAHGTFFGVGSVVASKLVPPEKQSSAVAMIFTGVSVANIVGVPLGTFVGQALGWRASFWIISALGVVAILCITKFIPQMALTSVPSFRQEIRVLKKPQVQLTLLMTILSFVGVFAAFTYIAPTLTDITKFSASAITPILLLYGLGLTIGNTVAGRLSDWKPMPTIIGMLALLTLVMGSFYITSEYKILAVITVFLWGFTSFGHVPGLQMRVIAKAKGAPNIAASLNISAFNLGIALGSFVGGVVINTSLGLKAIPLVAALLTVLCIGVVLVGWLFDSKEEKQVQVNQDLKIKNA